MVIEDTVMQGTVWAGLMCTSTMDKLGKQAYQDPNLMYKYKNNVFVPPLEMVDDVICASKCGSQVVATNTAVTTFVKLKKLQLGEKKCARLHIGRTNIQECSEIFVNGKHINEYEKEKYVGDYLTKYANPQSYNYRQTPEGKWNIVKYKGHPRRYSIGYKKTGDWPHITRSLVHKWNPIQLRGLVFLYQKRFKIIKYFRSSNIETSFTVTQ